MQLNPECVCLRCGHFKQNDVKIKFTCKAYPKGIPAVILDGEEKHSTRRKDQTNDVVFEEYSFAKHFNP